MANGGRSVRQGLQRQVMLQIDGQKMTRDGFLRSKRLLLLYYSPKQNVDAR